MERVTTGDALRDEAHRSFVTCSISVCFLCVCVLDKFRLVITTSKPTLTFLQVSLLPCQSVTTYLKAKIIKAFLFESASAKNVYMGAVLLCCRFP